ncbi:two-partner secretion domain-containing protein [Hydrogenophaga sp.]|uniref:two-partner secretion domain-containing protein n=1 Tax=Hydrogenophaga sp. TaxID=1904254 RepID=UPI002FC6547B
MNKSLFQLRYLSLVVAAMCAGGHHSAFAQPAALALPTGGAVVGGQVSIVQNGATLNIHQTSGQALVNFSTFNVGSAALVDIRQPGAASALLARVTGSDPSQIHGQIKANGSLWLINPAGIMVGQGARIDVGGFIASTLNVSDTDFLAGRMTFTSVGNAGMVSNAGAINAAAGPGGGRIYLVGQRVENTGSLDAPRGEVLLAAAQNVQLVDTGHPGVSIALSGASGDLLNLGRIVADAGRIGLAAGLVTNAGDVSASSAVSEGGRIFLRATDLKTTSTSDIQANGTSGGNVVLLADRAADIDGRVSATGSTGPGGFVDTSGHQSLNVKHAPTVGQGGSWLIDPSNLEVVAGAGGGATVEDGVIVSTEAGTTIGADVIMAQLNMGASVALATGNEGGALGNIVVNAAIAKTAGEDARLTLRAHNNIEINAPITSSAGALDLSLKNNFHGNTTDAGHAATLNSNLNLNGGVLEVSQGEALGNGTLNIAGGTTTLDGASSIQAAVVNVRAGAMLRLASTNDSPFSTGYEGRLVNSGTIVKTGEGSTQAALTNLAGGVLRIDEGGFDVTFSEDNANAGRVDIASGATLSSTVDLHNAGLIRGTGTVDLGGPAGARLVNTGVVAPGGSDEVGELTIDGGYTQGAQGALNIRLAGASADVLRVTGAVQLGGTVNLSTLGGGMPLNGTVADFLMGGNAGHAGSFATVNATAVVTPQTTGRLSVIYPATGAAVAQVKATTAPTAPVADICSIAPNSALCLVLSPPSASQPVTPAVQLATNMMISTVLERPLSVAPTTSDIAKSVAKVEAADSAKVNVAAKKMYCN